MVTVTLPQSPFKSAEEVVKRGVYVKSFADYAEKASVTAVFDPHVALPYLLLGLCNEIGEMQEIAQVIDEAENPTHERLRHFVLEAGDVYWYLGQLTRLVEAMEALEGEMIYASARRVLVYGGLSYLPQKPDTLSKACLAMSFHAAHLAGIGKKVLRNDGAVLARKKEVCAAHLWMVKYHLDQALHLRKIEPLYAMTANLHKLLDRAQRGVIRGDGDTR